MLAGLVPVLLDTGSRICNYPGPCCIYKGVSAFVWLAGNVDL